MKNSKMLTIVIPTYNMELYLNRCLDSLLIKNQTVFNKMQVLVVNDGSKDNSLEIAKKYETKYPNVFSVIDKENGNYGSCVNKGLELAEGKFFRILDADDWVITSQLEEFICQLENIEEDLVLTNYSFVTEKDKRMVSMRNAAYSKVFEIDDFDFHASGNDMLLRMHAMTYKTSLLHRIGLKLQCGISYTDAEYCYYPFVKASNMIFLNLDLYQYFLGREGQTVSKDSMVKNFNHFYLVGIRMLKDYLSITSLSKAKSKTLVYFISNSLFGIYAVCLIYAKQVSNDQIGKLREVDDLVSKERKLRNKVFRFTYRKIPFVLVWKLLGIRLGQNVWI